MIDLKKALAALLAAAIAGADCGAWASSFESLPRNVKPGPMGIGPVEQPRLQDAGGINLPQGPLTDTATPLPPSALPIGVPATPMEASAATPVESVSSADVGFAARALGPARDSSAQAHAQEGVFQGLGEKNAHIASGQQRPERAFSQLYDNGFAAQGSETEAVSVPPFSRSRRLRRYLLTHPRSEKMIQAGIFTTFSAAGIALELWQGNPAQQAWQRVCIAFASALFTQYAVFQVLKNWLERSVKDQAPSKALALVSASIMLMVKAAVQWQPAWLAQNVMLLITGAALYGQIRRYPKESATQDDRHAFSALERIAHGLDRLISWASVAALPLLAAAPLLTAGSASASPYFQQLAVYCNWTGNLAAIAMFVPQLLFVVTSRSPRSLSRITYLLYTVAGVLIGVAAAPINAWWSMQNSLGALLTGTILALTFEGSPFYRRLVLGLGVGACALFLSLYGPWIGCAASLGIAAGIVAIGFFRRNRRSSSGERWDVP